MWPTTTKTPWRTGCLVAVINGQKSHQGVSLWTLTKEIIWKNISSMKIIAFSSKEQYAFVKTNNGSLYLTLLVKNLNTEVTRMTESIFQLVRCSRVGYAPFNFFLCIYSF